MKRILIILVALVCLAGCVKAPKSTYTESNVEPFLTEDTLTVPVKAGYWSVVTCCGDTLCVTDEVGHVTLVPKNQIISETTKAGGTGGIEISYNLKTAHDYYKFAEDKLWQTIAFEDSKNGDYDYNDLVIHVEWKIKNGGLRVGIHPIAYGAQKTIALGLTVWQNGSTIYDDVVASNCRQDLFENISGTGNYINTKAYDHHYLLFSKVVTLLPVKSSANWKDLTAAWWIEVNGERIYAVNRRVAPDELLDDRGYPYGLVITKMSDGYYNGNNKDKVGYNWFFYPKETVSVWNWYRVLGGVFTYKEGVDGPDVNDFILKTGSEAKNQLYTVEDKSLN